MIKKIILILFFFLSINFSVQAQNISAIDTIAGYSTTIEIKNSIPQKDFFIKIKKPQQSTINIPLTANKQGFASFEFDGYHTKKTGIYQIFLTTNKNEEPVKPQANFQVFADVFSANKSKITSTQSSLSVNDEIILKTIIVDKYQNPIPGQIIKLLSSRPEDTITENSVLTDENGIAVFTVFSKTPGVSIFTAINQTTNQEISARKKIIFYSPEEKYAIGGNDFSANLTDLNSNNFTPENFGVLDHFAIEFPDTLEINEEAHLKIIVQDQDNNTVKNYTGTIKIEVLGDDNAVIPNNGEYTFTEKDQGEKSFFIAMSFTVIGEKTIRIFDFENGRIDPSITGEKKINVVEKKTDEIPALQQDIEIKAPVNNAKLSTSVLTISGLAAPNTNLKLMLDDQKIADISVDTEGFFSKTIENIEDGKHDVFVMEKEGLRRSSASVIFFIDSTPPNIIRSEFSPAEIYTNDPYTITLESEKELETAQIRFNGIVEKLTESKVTPGLYEISLTAPSSPGTQDIDFILTDQMGNEGLYSKQLTLEILEKIIIKPEKITNILATTGDASIEITWKKPVSKLEIKNYKIYLGTEKNNLKFIQESSKLYAKIDNLENNQEYFIAVTATDMEGHESDKSEPITAQPEKILQICTGNKYSETGKEPCFICPEPYTVTENNTKCEIVENLHPAAKKLSLRSIAGNSKITLMWDNVKNAAQYKILFGISSKNYEEEIIVKDSLSYVINDLLNNLEYFLTVEALDENGFTISQYPEIKTMPKGFGFKIFPAKKTIPQAFLKDFSQDKVIKGNTGPEEIILLIFSMIISAVLFIFKFKKNKKIIKNIPRKFHSNKLQF